MAKKKKWADVKDDVLARMTRKKAKPDTEKERSPHARTAPVVVPQEKEKEDVRKPNVSKARKKTAKGRKEKGKQEGRKEGVLRRPLAALGRTLPNFLYDDYDRAD